MTEETIVVYNEVGKILRSLQRIVNKLAKIDVRQNEYLSTISELAEKVEEKNSCQ